MKKFCFLILIIIFFGISNVFSQATPPKSDFEFWNETQVSFPLIKKKYKNNKEFDQLSFFLTGNLRIGQNLKHYIDERIGFGFDFKVNQNVSLSTSYLYRSAQPYKNRKDFEHRLRFSINLDKKFEKISLRDRNILEYRSRNSRQNITLYQNKFYVLYPILKTKKELYSPYIADEVYFDFSTEMVNRNEFFLGITKKLSKNTSSDFFYVWQRNRGISFRNVNAFGINLKFRIA